MAQWVMAHFERRQFRKFVHFLRILFLSWTAAEGHAWWWLPIPSSTIACGWRPISATAGWTYLFSVGWRRSAGRDLDAGGAAGGGGVFFRTTPFLGQRLTFPYFFPAFASSFFSGG